MQLACRGYLLHVMQIFVERGAVRKAFRRFASQGFEN
jgi:hypothetical protein